MLIIETQTNVIAMPMTVSALKMFHDAQLHALREYLTPNTIEHLNISDDENDYACSMIELAHDLRQCVYHVDFDSNLDDDDFVPDDIMPFNVDDIDSDDYPMNKYAEMCPEMHDAFTVIDC